MKIIQPVAVGSSNNISTGAALGILQYKLQPGSYVIQSTSDGELYTDAAKLEVSNPSTHTLGIDTQSGTWLRVVQK
jgi:hypothetical protein